MAILLEDNTKYNLPRMYKIRQIFPNDELVNIPEIIRQKMMVTDVSKKILPGMRVAVCVGSRGIKNILTIVSTVVNVLLEKGAKPFILSAMGSHGNGTEEGQREILSSYGITEDNLHIPIVTKVNVRKIGVLSSNVPLFFDQEAIKADLIIPINRIKIHTDFVGDIQSGLCKMLVIGLGNQKGCSTIHEVVPSKFSQIIEEGAKTIIEKTNVGFGVAILENGYDKTACIDVIPAEHIVAQEKILLKTAKKYMPFIRLTAVDVLIMKEIGKNISGAGYDPNIVGRSSVLKEFMLPFPKIKKMILLDITDSSHGNGIGLGLFDIITKKVFHKLDFEAMYTNAVACKCIEDVKIPLMVDTEEEAIRIAVRTIRNVQKKNLKIVRIKNTLQLEYIEVSEALLPEVKKNEYMEVQT
ncbi:lactate racemase domain-containing protein [Pectinatus cerevisiiphilus]|uniref:Uncharacterized protein DUF2088 n=1 Tax=Pectinatus cerevisiiphilus TaxID=86956 RepID=A0A4V2URX8_9FIRM|nr:lactate racemase domain-containing protein [Pectinatus cerevisiiphilus]TCS79272.1 uncharacterized protein DUF2088 [Pectinatus cerevisiiphilus]